jgi:hypothetical protein
MGATGARWGFCGLTSSEELSSSSSSFNSSSNSASYFASLNLAFVRARSPYFALLLEELASPISSVRLCFEESEEPRLGGRFVMVGSLHLLAFTNN